ncbi:MAG: SMI1/KNR4 family protein [Stappiaceae bacterium]
MDISQYADQVERIKDKLVAAREADPEFKCFGAEAHKYRLDPPLQREELDGLEERYKVKLPSDLRAFFLSVGNGLEHKGYWGLGGAGPHYGLRSAETIIRSADTSKDCPLTPDMTGEEWQEIYDRWENDEIDLADLTRGCTFIASQGCSYTNELVLKGPHAGRVINFDEEGSPPWFAYEKNFLDWYERWLDEVIAGYLTKKDALWFGVTLGGDDRALLKLFDQSSDEDAKFEALRGLYKLVELEPVTVSRLLELASGEAEKIQETAVRVLADFQISEAEPFIVKIIANDNANLGLLCSSLEDYERLPPKVEEALLGRLERSDNDRLFYRMLWIRKKHGTVIGPAMAKYFKRADPELRNSIISTLSREEDLSEFVPVFALALREESAEIVANALRAIKGLNHSSLVAAFPKIRRRCQQESGWDKRGHILQILEIRQKETRGFKQMMRRVFSL